ncbi:MAG: nucleotidyltransferase family protein [Actinobacteria bacterium]|nr:MAG: nucleotidyltransferase family protein [Actinomycetota bacterium]
MTGSLTVAVVLAAGSGTRFVGSTHKLLTPAEGRPVYHWAIESAIEASIGPVVVVTGKTPLPLDIALSDKAQSSITKWGLPHSINNPNWSTGMASSVQCAIAYAASLGAQAVVIGLADQPCVPPSAWQRVASSTAPLAVATYDTKRGNPVKLHAEMWSHVPTSGDEGARHLLRSHHQLVSEVSCIGSAIDIDTIEDLEQASKLIIESRKAV